MGFLSTVPSNAGDLLKAAVDAAAKGSNNFPGLLFSFFVVVLDGVLIVVGAPAISQPAPAGTVRPTAGPNATLSRSGCSTPDVPSRLRTFLIFLSLLALVWLLGA